MLKRDIYDYSGCCDLYAKPLFSKRPRDTTNCPATGNSHSSTLSNPLLVPVVVACRIFSAITTAGSSHWPCIHSNVRRVIPL
jgi:hypothetical protein